MRYFNLDIVCIFIVLCLGTTRISIYFRKINIIANNFKISYFYRYLELCEVKSHLGHHSVACGNSICMKNNYILHTLYLIKKDSYVLKSYRTMTYIILYFPTMVD